MLDAATEVANIFYVHNERELSLVWLKFSVSTKMFYGCKMCILCKTYSVHALSKIVFALDIMQRSIKSA